MAEQIERYLETAGAQVRWRRVRPALERELRTHLEEQTEAYLAEGMTEDAAEAEAVRQMGDAETVGLALDAVHRPKKQTAILLFAGLPSCLECICAQNGSALPLPSHLRRGFWPVAHCSAGIIWITAV